MTLTEIDHLKIKPVSPWTPERVERLRVLWGEGKMRARDIAGELGGGLNRNKVIGKARRLGLRQAPYRHEWSKSAIQILQRRWHRGDSVASISAELGCKETTIYDKVRKLGLSPRNKHRKKTEHTEPRTTINSQGRIVPIFDEVKPSIDDLAIPVEQRKTLLELTNGDCRYPVGDPRAADFFFCGAACMPNRPYCPQHAARCYDGVPKSRIIIPPPRVQNRAI